MSSITVVREGLFGSVAVDVAQGSPTGTFPNDFGAGQLVINGSPLSFTGSRRNVTFFATVSLVSNLQWRKLFTNAQDGASQVRGKYRSSGVVTEVTAMFKKVFLFFLVRYNQCLFQIENLSILCTWSQLTQHPLTYPVAQTLLPGPVEQQLLSTAVLSSLHQTAKDFQRWKGER